MAREYARVKVAIWADSDFRTLSGNAQHLYFVLLTSPTMTLCGVADWRPKRLAALVQDWTIDTVQDAADELTHRGYIVADDDTEEVLIRSFVRHDGLIKTPNIASAMAKDFAGTASALLRGVVVHELQRLRDEDPGMKGWATASTLLSEPAINPSEIPSPNPSGNPSEMALPIPSGDASHIPQPSTINKQPSSPASRRKPEIPLPDDWQPTESHATYAAENRIDLAREAFKFRNHAAANDRRQRNWNAAFTTWLANADDFRPAKRKDAEPGEWWR